MEARHSDLLPILKVTQQFEVPIYQRMYSWENEHCQQLFDDIIKCGEADESYKHFIGSIVYVESEMFQPPRNKPRLIIDGQQRLTTIMLLLHALSEELTYMFNSDMELPKGYSGSMLRNDYLINLSEDENSDNYFKLILSQNDKETLKAIIAGRDFPSNGSIRVTKNYHLLQALIKANQSKIYTIIKGIEKLAIVVIELKRGQDNPQLVFESMNSTGKDLSESDKIRNFILMELNTDLQKRLYNDYWRPMEKAFGQTNYNKYFDSFMRDYLTLKAGRIIDIKQIYSEFKFHVNNISNEEFVRELKSFAEYYTRMALNKEEDPELREAFNDIKDLKVKVIYPFLLVLYDDYAKGILQKNEFLKILNYCESYIFRLSLTTASSGSRNKAFAHLAKEMLKPENKDEYLIRAKQRFQWLEGNQYFPRNEKFIESIKSSNLYKIPSQDYWLRKIESYERREPVPYGNLTREHIMPQTLTDEWKGELGVNWERDYVELLHNLGNLTLTAYNTEYSNYPFETKRDLKEHGLRYSPLYLNQGLGEVKIWNKEAIIARAERLAQRALLVWPFPDIENENE